MSQLTDFNTWQQHFATGTLEELKHAFWAMERRQFHAEKTGQPDIAVQCKKRVEAADDILTHRFGDNWEDQEQCA
ncbi:MAG: hypothetical protein HRU20_25720 [Pseudomonadales bacterium]|nr:hypothetical protein [Pseudomonadales bacterium]